MSIFGCKQRKHENVNEINLRVKRVGRAATCKVHNFHGHTTMSPGEVDHAQPPAKKRRFFTEPSPPRDGQENYGSPVSEVIDVSYPVASPNDKFPAGDQTLSSAQ